MTRTKNLSTSCFSTCLNRFLPSCVSFRHETQVSSRQLVSAPQSRRFNHRVLCCSSRRANWCCVTSSSCAGPPTVTCPTPRRPSSASWLRSTTGRGSAEKDAPSSTACESPRAAEISQQCFQWSFHLNLTCFMSVTNVLEKNMLRDATMDAFILVVRCFLGQDF